MACEFYHDPFFLPYFFEEKMNYSSKLGRSFLVEDDYSGIIDYENDRYHRLSCHNDIIKLLPANPFEMDFSPTIHDVTDWFEDLEASYQSPANDDTDCVMDAIRSSSNVPRNSSHGSPLAVAVMDESLSVSNDSGSFQGTKSEENASTLLGIFFALSHVGVRDLLAVEQVCKSLNLMVRSDPLLWKSIQIKEPLNERITDESLIQIASKAQGKLQWLSLVECPKITDNALKQIVKTNKNITKLFVPGCTRLTMEGILECLKGLEKVKQVRVGGLYGVTWDDLEMIKLKLGGDSRVWREAQKPQYYGRGEANLGWGDERAIDIEMCGKCERVRMVYDCPLEECGSLERCRACTICIPRCVICGRCIVGAKYEESFCLDFVCFQCYS